MDLMYGGGAEYDISLQELIECDLKTEMERIMAAAGTDADLMTELANSPLLSDEGFEEFAAELDSQLLRDPYGYNFGPKVVSAPVRIPAQPVVVVPTTPHTNPWNNSTAAANPLTYEEPYGIMVSHIHFCRYLRAVLLFAD